MGVRFRLFLTLYVQSLKSMTYASLFLWKVGTGGNVTKPGLAYRLQDPMH